ncbi:YbaK/EbsC family protein [Pseudokineococcus basanitobsidens]|uniref:YbaK/EbsC family protein n=1 Tax=Pseudokineococcus basanitobsidens TaxID=1926649 RepID=A0ABU8RH98_9ACTN
MDEVVTGAEVDPRVTRVRHALADAGADADVVVLDHAPRSADDLAAQVGAPAGALVRCHLLLAEEVDVGGRAQEGPDGEQEGPDGETTTPAAPSAGAPVRVLLVVAPVGRRLLLSQVAEAATGLGVGSVRRPPPREVRALTGSSPEDLPPLGLPGDRLVVEAVLVDTALREHEVLWVPAGRPGTLLAVGHDELLRLTLGHPVELASAGPPT